MKSYDSLIRVSKMGAREESAETTMTVADQRKTCARAVGEVGGKIGREHKALDQSGRTVHQSAAYAAILERVRTKQTDGVVVAYGDRLTRNWRAVGAFYDACEQAGAEIIIAGLPGVDYRTSAGRMVTGMMAVVGDMVGSQAKERGEKIADATIARGVPNKVSYGYRRNASNPADPSTKTDPERDVKGLVPDPDQAAIVRRIFELRAQGHGGVSIARKLNEAGVPGPRGGRWTPGTIDKVVKNETYLGVVTLGERRVEGAHAPLVTRTQWLRAQNTRPVVRNGRLVGGVAQGLLVCSGCERPLSPMGSGSDGRRHYGCRRESSAGVCPRPVYVSKPDADEYVIDSLDDLLAEGATFALSGAAHDLELLRVERERAQEELDAFVDVVSASEPSFRRGYDRRKAAIEAAQAALDAADIANDDDLELPTADEWQQLVAADDVSALRRIASVLIDRITVSPPASRSKFSPIADRFALAWQA